MTRKDYKAIAHIISVNTRLKTKDTIDNSIDRVSLINDLCDYLQVDNRLFDRNRFIKACLPDNLTDEL